MDTIDNEELMDQLQHISALARRSRRAHVKNRIKEEGGKKECHGHGKPCHHRHHNIGAFAAPDTGHGYGNHKCHGGSGRHGQNRVLAVLSMQEGINQKDLAYILGIRPQSLGEALAKLEESALIERRQNVADKRATNVFLTEEGRSRAAKVAEDRKKAASDVFAVLTDEEKNQLGTILDKLAASFNEQLGEKEED